MEDVRAQIDERCLLCAGSPVGIQHCMRHRCPLWPVRVNPFRAPWHKVRQGDREALRMRLELYDAGWRTLPKREKEGGAPLFEVYTAFKKGATIQVSDSSRPPEDEREKCYG